MYEYGFPFDNAAIDNFDRNASSDEFADYLEIITGMEHGVYPNPSTNLQILADSGNRITIKAGACMIKGRIRRLTNDVNLTLDRGENTDRIDRIVMRVDKANRSVTPQIIKGVAAERPNAPNITRSGDIYDIALADVRVPKLGGAIEQQHITDLRSNKELCGYMPVFGSFDTTSLFNQYQDALNKYLDLVDAALDGTAAGHLQGQIDDINARSLQKNTRLNFNVSIMSQDDVNNAIKQVPKDLGGHNLVIVFEGERGAPYWNINIRDFYNGNLYIDINDQFPKHIEVINVKASVEISGSTDEFKRNRGSELRIVACPIVTISGRLGAIFGSGFLTSYDSTVILRDIILTNIVLAETSGLISCTRSTLFVESFYNEYAIGIPEDWTISPNDKAGYIFYDLESSAVFISGQIDKALYNQEYRTKTASIITY